MTWQCEILADSIGPHGYRLTTFEVEFPRMVLADYTRHRSLSYSFESTRARPTELLIEQVREDPYIPQARKRAKGMGGGEPLSPWEQADFEMWWRKAARDAADNAERLLFIGKEHCGRILEPFAWISGIISGTEWENFFALRCPPEGEAPDNKYPAQIELQIIASMQRDLYRSNWHGNLKALNYGDWHLPLFTSEDALQRWPDVTDPLLPAKVSAGRIATVSFKKHHQNGSVSEGYERWENKLAPSAHWSPGEHPAKVVAHNDPLIDTGNFIGFKQLRKHYPGEAIRDAS
jgi:hypothetical protein